MTDCELRLPPDVRYVGLARLVVTAAARQAGMSDERIEDLRIAVSEAAANAITVHRRSRTPAPIILAFGVAGSGRFEVLVADAGPAAPREAAEQTEEWTAEDGLAATLIEGLADDVEFTAQNGERANLRFVVGLEADRQDDQ